MSRLAKNTESLFNLLLCCQFVEDLAFKCANNVSYESYVGLVCVVWKHPGTRIYDTVMLCGYSRANRAVLEEAGVIILQEAACTEIRFAGGPPRASE